jgi:hypothetical protein
LLAANGGWFASLVQLCARAIAEATRNIERQNATLRVVAISDLPSFATDSATLGSYVPATNVRVLLLCR